MAGNERRDGARQTGRAAYLEALCRTVPYHIVERVLADPREQAVETEHFDGSIMFADVVGFTALCERLASSGAEGLSRLSRILNVLFSQLLDEAIFPYAGYVVQFGGDSLTVVFRGEDQARRCAAAALACQRHMYGETGRLLGGKSRELMLRVGLAMGPLRLTVLGDLNRRAVVAAGPTAHRVLQLQKAAQPNMILADVAFADALSGNAEVVDRRKGTCVIRGLRHWPERLPIAELGDGLLHQQEEKIALLRPFVAEPLAARMRTTPKGWRIQGELRDAVIVFLELWGLDDAPENAADLEHVSNLARSLLRAYRKYGGMVAKADLAERGHRAMILFGLYRPGENDAERALLAALEATARLQGFVASGDGEVGVRTGVHCGRVYFGAIGSSNKHDITVVGDAVNVAARTVAAAEPFEVLATDAVMAAVTGEFEHSPRGKVRVKGKTSGIPMHVVHAPVEGRAHYAMARRHSRFTAGRQHELAQLQDRVDVALAGQGGMLGLCGARGTGKSFLLAAAIDRWVRGGGVATIARCRYATRSSPLAPVVSMFSAYLGLTSRDGDADRRERIRKGLEPFGLEGGAPELVALLHPVKHPDGSTEAAADLADVQAQERVLSSIVEFVERRIDNQPVLYVIEDLHFADTLTLDLARRLRAMGRNHSFLIVATYRPDSLLEQARRWFDEELLLSNFTLQESNQLVAHEVGADEVDTDLGVFLWQRSGGNPGHLVEITRFLAERQMLSVRAGMVVAPEPGLALLEDIVPKTLAQVALTRLDDLGAVERRLLRMASAIGRRFGRPLLEDVVEEEMGADLMASAMASLEGQRVIVPSSHEQQGYMFRDGVTRAVAYGTIPEPERRGIHARIADAIEALPAHDPRRTAASIAMHRDRAGQWGQAARWYQRAAQGAVRAGLDPEAVDLVERFDVTLLKVPPDEQPSPASRARTALLALVAIGRQGQTVRTLRTGRQLAAQYWSHLDIADRAVVDYWLGNALASLGRPEKARIRLERVFKAPVGDLQRSDAARLLAQMHVLAHRPGDATPWLDQAARLAGADRYRALRVDMLRADLLRDAGDLEEARRIYEQVRGATTRSEHLAIAAHAASGVAYCDLLVRRFDAAVQGFEQALVMDRALRTWSHQIQDLIRLGQTHLWAGRAELARGPLERGLALAEEAGDEVQRAEAMVHLGAVIAATRDPVEGTVLCEEGFKRAVRAEARTVEVMADLHLLRIALLRDDAGAVEVGVRRCAAHGQHLAAVPLLRQAFAELRPDTTSAAG